MGLVVREPLGAFAVARGHQDASVGEHRVSRVDLEVLQGASVAVGRRGASAVEGLRGASAVGGLRDAFAVEGHPVAFVVAVGHPVASAAAEEPQDAFAVAVVAWVVGLVEEHRVEADLVEVHRA